MRAFVVVVTLAVLTGSAAADVTLTVTAPIDNSVHGDSVDISASATSLYEVTVTATAGANSVMLTLAGGTYTGTLSLIGLPEGATTVTITAAEKAPGTGTATAQRTIRHEVPPVLTLTAPRWHDVFAGTGTLHLTLMCAASGGACPSVELGTESAPGVNRQPVMTFPNVTTLDQDIAFAPTGDLMIYLRTAGPLGIESSIDRPIHIDDTAANTPLLHRMLTARGLVLDADADRTLWVDETGQVGILYRDHCDNVILDPSGGPVDHGYLTPHGALVGLVEYRDGARIGHVGDPSTVRFANPFAVWFDTNATGGVRLLDTTTGDTSTITTNTVAGANPVSLSVGANGVVAYSVPHVSPNGNTLHRWATGVDTSLGEGFLTSTDGTFIAADVSHATPTDALNLWDATGHMESLIATSDSLGWTPGVNFLVGGGRAAYAGTGIVVREADGTRHIAVASNANRLKLITTTGDLYYGNFNGTDAGNFRVGASGGEYINKLGRVVEGAHHGLIVTGRGLFAAGDIPPCTTPDCAASCDGGGIRPAGGGTDAGVDAAGGDDAGSGNPHTGGGGGCCDSGGDGSPWLALLWLLKGSVAGRRRSR